MVREIIWTETALKDRLKIYLFWQENNQSNTYSEKLENEFKNAAQLLANFPEIGQKTDYQNIRTKIVKNYRLFYRFMEDKIEIIKIWDTRQNDDNLNID